MRTTDFDIKKYLLELGSGGGQVVSVLALTPTIQVRISLKSTFFCKIEFEKNKNKQKEARVGPFSEKYLLDEF